MPDPLNDPTRLHLASHLEAPRSAAFDSTSSQSAGTDNNEPERPPKFHPPTHPGDIGHLGRYRVLKQLGKGGMGTVFLGIDDVLQRKVAIKVLTPKFAAIPIARERFLREARTASAVSSPHVVSIIDVDEDFGNPFIAMEYLQGIPLDRYIATHPTLSVRQVLRIGQEVARGLAAAHEAGLVHRDIKPANLWLEAPHGHVKILDFGLAKETESQGRGDVTQAGQVVGTPAFMSPEQARGDVVDARTDLFCLGIVLYRLCTGEQPFIGPTAMAVLMSVGIDEPPPIRQKNPKVPEALAALIHQMLRKKPEERPQSAIEVHNALVAIEEGKGRIVPEAARAEPTSAIVVAPQGDRVWEQIDITKASGDETVQALPPSRKQAEREVKFPWLLVGSALGLLAVVLGVVGYLMTRPKPVEPFDETEPPRPTPVTPVTPKSDPERKAAEWILGQPGHPSVEIVGQISPVTNVAKLPTTPFKLRRVSLTREALVTDGDLPLLMDLTGLEAIHFERTLITDVGMEKLSKCFSAANLTELSLGTEVLTDDGLWHFGEFKSLKSVALSGPHISHHGVRILHRHCPHLTHLYLPGVKLRDLDLVPFLGVGRWFSQLEHLGISCPPITSFGLGNFSNWHGLKSLHIWGRGLTDRELEVVAKIPSLATLGLHDSAVTDAGLLKLAKIPGLKRLEITSSPGVTNAGILKFKAAAPDCVLASVTRIGAYDPERRAAEWTLSKVGGHVTLHGAVVPLMGLGQLPARPIAVSNIDLSLTAHVFTDTDLDHLAPLSELVSVKTGKCKLTDAGLKRWSDFPLAEKYTALGIPSPDLTNDGLKYLRSFPSLTWLDLSNTGVSDEGLRSLASLKHLTTLVAKNTRLTEAGMRKLRAALPQCRIIGDVALGKTTLPLDEKWVLGVSKMPPAEQVRAVSAELVRRNPRFDGRLVPTITPRGVDALHLHTDSVVDISPLAVLTTLTRLHCTSDERGIGALVDVAPLASLTNLRELSLERNRGILDISVLKPLRLSALNIGGTSVANIALLSDMPLKVLQLNPIPIKDLSPLLKCSELAELYFDLGFVGGMLGNHIEALRPHPGLKHVDGIPTAAFWAAWDRRKDPSKLLRPQKLLPTQQRSAQWVSFDSEGKHLASFGAEGVLQVWDLASGEKHSGIGGKTGDWKMMGQAVEFVAGTDLLATSHLDGIRFWNLQTGKQEGESLPPHELFCGFALSPDGKTVVGHSSSGKPPNPILRHVVATRQPLPGLVGHSGGVLLARFSNDSKFLATSSMYPDGSVRVWDLSTGKDVYRQDRPWIDPVVGLAFSPDGQFLMVASMRSTIDLIDWKTKKIEKSFRWFPISGAAFAPGGKHLILQGNTGIVSVMDIATGEVISEAFGGTAANFTRGGRVVVSPDGKTIATSFADGNIRLWDWDTLRGKKP